MLSRFGLIDPSTIAFVETPGVAYDVALEDGLAYVADGASGLQVIDVSTPVLNAAILGWTDTPGSAGNVAVSDGLAYVADGNSGLQVIDVSDPVSPAILGATDTPGAASAVVVAGDVAYVADDDAGLQVIDVSPYNPPGECMADLDGNGDVGFEDLSALLSKWGPCDECPADMKGAGIAWVGSTRPETDGARPETEVSPDRPDLCSVFLSNGDRNH